MKKIYEDFHQNDKDANVLFYLPFNKLTCLIFSYRKGNSSRAKTNQIHCLFPKVEVFF